MDPRELEGCLVLAVVYGSDLSVSYVRGLAKCDANDVLIAGENGKDYKVQNDFASSSMPVDDAVRAAAPESVVPLLRNVTYVVPVPPPNEDFALATTPPGWRGRLAK